MASIPFKVPFKRYKYSTVPVGESLTLQSMKDECDINNIIRKYTATGLIDHVKTVEAQYADFSDIVDYQTAVMSVQAANDAFSDLPSNIRARFKNSPHELMSFLLDDNNRSEAVELGLIDKPIKVDPIAPNSENLA